MIEFLLNPHGLANLVVVVVIAILQFSYYIKNKNSRKTFLNIFPKEIETIEIEKDNNNNVVELKIVHSNNIWSEIIKSINNYLSKNKGRVSDFHLIKDIVDRNCDAHEEEINTQVPVPLYLGLAGTMAGILIGVSFLVFTGSLKSLLGNETGINAEDGIEALLGGVALAMISSIIGIVLTTRGTLRVKTEKVKVESKKIKFLSWMQEELLPQLSNDTAKALEKMTEKLSDFNTTFSENTENFEKILDNVTKSCETQNELINAIKNLNITKIANANIEVYNKLKNCTNEIGIFAEFLKNSNIYLQNIQSLNNKLDEYERRTQVIENAGNFYQKNEIWLAGNMDSANLLVEGAITRFNDNTQRCLNQLKDSLDEQILGFNGTLTTQQDTLQNALTQQNNALIQSITDQQTAFQNRLNEFPEIVQEIKNLTHIKEGIDNFKDATNNQNKKIEDLTNAIKNLANVKTVNGAIKQEITLPKWIKTLIIAVSSMFIFISLFMLIYLLSK